MRTFAVIPAAGKSTRMGRPKLALPLGSRTVLEAVVLALHAADIQPILVVVGPHVPELVPLAEAVGASVLQLGSETVDMRATVIHGLDWLERQHQPRAEDNWLLVPADHPTLDAAVVRLLLAARQANPEKSMVVPTFTGRRGHPTLIGWNHVAGMRRLPAEHGLNVYLRQQAAATLEVPVASPTVLLDLDTPSDYELLVRSLGERGVATPCVATTGG